MDECVTIFNHRIKMLDLAVVKIFLVVRHLVNLLHGIFAYFLIKVVSLVSFQAKLHLSINVAEEIFDFLLLLFSQELYALLLVLFFWANLTSLASPWLSLDWFIFEKLNIFLIMAHFLCIYFFFKILLCWLFLQ